MGYTAETPVISIDAAEELGRFLGKYAIHIGGLLVRHRLKDGRLVVDRPLADTIAATAGAGVIGGPLGAAAGVTAAAAGVSLAFAPWLLPAAVLNLVNSIRMTYNSRKATPGGSALGAVSSVVTFDLTDVSDKRRKWSEYLLCLWAERHGWAFTGLRHPAQQAAAQRYAATHDGYPPPWGETARSAPTGQPRQPSKRQADNPRGGIIRRAIRDLF